MSVVVDGLKTVYVDVDETLVMSDLSAYPKGDWREVEYHKGPVSVVPNQKNINLLILFYKLGYTVVVWSKTGSDWGNCVCNAFGIDKYVSVYLTKPGFYIDDKDVTEWMGPRRWRNNLEGKA